MCAAPLCRSRVKRAVRHKQRNCSRRAALLPLRLMKLGLPLAGGSTVDYVERRQGLGPRSRYACRQAQAVGVQKSLLAGVGGVCCPTVLVTRQACRQAQAAGVHCSCCTATVASHGARVCLWQAAPQEAKAKFVGDGLDLPVSSHFGLARSSLKSKKKPQHSVIAVSGSI